MTSSPASAACAGTIRSTAVLAKIALRDSASHSSPAARADVLGQHVGGVDGVLAGHHHQRRRIVAAGPEPGDDHRRDELEDGRTDRGGDDVGLGDLLDHQRPLRCGC